MRGTLAERLNARLTPDPETGCLLWAGALACNGYGRIKVGGRRGKSRYVHVVAWELENGPVPDGLDLDHVRERGCLYRHCANVAHLEPVTRRENLMRSDSALAAINARKTHCPAGHPYDEANTRYYRGARVCRACWRRAADRKRRRAELAALPS